MNALFDTNILIDFLKNVPLAVSELKRYGRDSKSISLITWIEVMAGATPENEAETRKFLEQFLIFSTTEDVAERSARIRREWRMKLPDAIIWATALEEGCLLVTRNTRDFPADDPGIRIPYKI